MIGNNTMLNETFIQSAGEVDGNILCEFYNKIYPGRGYARIWRWINRPSFYANKTPLVMFLDGRVIAHAGMIPFHVQMDGRRYTASWFVDFAVLPEFQKKGLGTWIASKWMEYSDISLEIGHNEGSGAVFKKLGWTESAGISYLVHYFLKPFDYYKFRGTIPAFIRRVLNTVSYPVFAGLYSRYAYDSLDMMRLAEASLDELASTAPVSYPAVLPVRDAGYVRWRLFESPDKDMYRAVGIAGTEIRLIIKLYDDMKDKYIDILWVSDSSDNNKLCRAVSSLALWGARNGYSYIRHYTSDKALCDFLSSSLKGLVNMPGFMFYSKDAELSKKLKACRWDWQLIDNDFERLSVCHS